MSKTKSGKSARAAKRRAVFAGIAVAIIIIFLVCAFLLWHFRPDIVDKFLSSFNSYNDNQSPEAPAEGVQNEIAQAEFSIHFLDVGNKYTGDCILIDCGDTEALIDAGSRKNSGPTLVDYINGYCGDGKLEYVIATHSDQDHISAFLGESNKQNGIFGNFEIGTFIMFDKSGKEPTPSNLYGQFLTAVENLPESTRVFTAGQCYDERDGALRRYFLNESKTLSLNILYNYYYYNVDKNNENNHSVVTLLAYESQTEISYYLFTGDLEAEGEQKMVEYYKDELNSKSRYDILPQVELFKAGHHGSYTASTEALLEIIKPKYVAVSCCAGSDEYAKDSNHYFPAQEFIDRISGYTDKIYCTDIVNEDGSGYSQMNGNIVFYYSGGLKLYCSNNNTILKETEWFKNNRKWNGA